ncbi:MAG: hypothetical protein K6F53_08190 [Lachnospiraceae bacterium]|nr:hypothetical protein [Lachnospiraceae bacterium]
MIDKDKFHVLKYVEKEDYIGSMDGMRYMLHKDGEEIEVVIWPEPDSFGATDDALKQRTKVPFSEDGVMRAADYLNEQYETQRELWEIARKKH